MYHLKCIWEKKMYIHWTFKQTNTSALHANFTLEYGFYVMMNVILRFLKSFSNYISQTARIHLERERYGFHWISFLSFSSIFYAKKIVVFELYHQSSSGFCIYKKFSLINHVWKYLKYLIQQNPKTASTLKTKI